MENQTSTLLNRRRIRRSFGKFQKLFKCQTLLKFKGTLMINTYKCILNQKIDKWRLQRSFQINIPH